MPLFLIERTFAEALQDSGPEAAAAAMSVIKVNEDLNVRWLYSFLSADKRKTYCLYEAPSAEAIREAARRLNLPADVIVDVSMLDPAALTGGASGPSVAPGRH